MRWLLQTWRTGLTSPSAAPPAAQTPRDVTGWIIRPTAKRTEQEQANLTRIIDRYLTLRTLGLLVGDFAEMLRKRRGSISTPGSRTRGPAISRSCRDSRRSAQGLRHRPKRTHRFRSSGAVEGAVCRLKALKRQMFRRAKFHLLRQRILRRRAELARVPRYTGGHHYHLRPSAHRRHRNPPPPRADVPRALTSSRPQRKRLRKPSTARPTAMSSASAPASVRPRRPRSP